MSFHQQPPHAACFFSALPPFSLGMSSESGVSSFSGPFPPSFGLVFCLFFFSLVTLHPSGLHITYCSCTAVQQRCAYILRMIHVTPHDITALQNKLPCVAAPVYRAVYYTTPHVSTFTSHSYGSAVCIPHGTIHDICFSYSAGGYSSNTETKALILKSHDIILRST